MNNRLLPPLLLAVLTLASVSLFAPLGVDPHHDGMMLLPALDLAAGKTLFRDTFSQYGAVTSLLQAGAMKAFGERLLVLRLQTAVFYALTVFLLWQVWRRFLPAGLAALCGLAFIFTAPYFLNNFHRAAPNFGWWLLPWASVCALLFQSLALLLALISYERRPRVWAAAAGAAAAVTLWTRQPVGALLFAALAAGFSFPGPEGLRRALHDRALPCAAGFAAVNAVFLLWLYSTGALSDMWRQSVLAPLAWASGAGPGLSAFLPVAGGLSADAVLWVSLPAACLLYSLALVRDAARGRPPAHPALPVALAVCLASWFQYYPVPCERHAYWAAAPMLGFFALAVRAVAERFRPGLGTAAAALALLLVTGPAAAYRLSEARIKLGRPYHKLASPPPLAGMKAAPAEAALLEDIGAVAEAYYRGQPEGGVLNVTNDALFSLYGRGRPAAHMLYAFWPELGRLYPDYLPSAKNYVRERKPLIFSKGVPADIEGYELLARWRNVFVSGPAAPGRAWVVSRVDPADYSPDKPLDAVFDLELELRPAGGEGAVLTGFRVLALDGAGKLLGGWLPAAPEGGKPVLLYGEGAPRAGSRLELKKGAKTSLLLKGHRFPFRYSRLRLRVEAAGPAGRRESQEIALPPLLDPL